MFRLFYRIARLSVVCLLMFAFSPLPAQGVAPGFVSDQDLAKCPVIVVGKWNGAPRQDNSLVEGKVLKEYEVVTEIDVTRVVKGNIKPGKHTILVGFRIGWSNEHPIVTSYTSTEVGGDAEATKDNLWFLVARRSRVDQKEHWCLDTHRGVQPLTLEPYYTALQDGDVTRHIPQLLKFDDELIRRRTLALIGGGRMPWPYEPPSFIQPDKKETPLKGQEDRIRSLILQSKSKIVRRQAASLYAHLAGESAVPFMRTRLDDDDPEVRAIALGTLALYKERCTADVTAKAVRDSDSSHISCELIKRLNEWGDPSTVPALIEFLQDDYFGGQLGNDFDVPALKSRAALFKITNHWFPFDVVASRDAWATAKDLQDPQERLAHLARTIPGDPEPWQATLVVENGSAFVEITNRSKQTLTLPRHPFEVTLSSSRGVSGFAIKGEAGSGKQKFIQLDPGKSHRFELATDSGVEKKWLTGRGGSLDLAYISSGKEAGVKAWMGVISISIPNR